MRITFTSYLSQTSNNFVDELGTFVSRQKEIILVAAAALALVAAAFAVYLFWFKGRAASNETGKKEMPEPARTVLIDEPKKGSEISKGFFDEETILSEEESNQKNKETPPQPKVEVKEEPKNQPLANEAPPQPKVEPIEEKIVDQPAPAPQPVVEEPPLAEDQPVPISQPVVKMEETKEVTPKIVEEVKTKKHPFEDIVLSFGKVRKSTQPGDTPAFENKPDGCVDNEKFITAAFACCFHTQESHQEILQLLKDIRAKMDPGSFPDGEYEVTSWNRLLENLYELHNRFVGEREKKEMKIYWSEAVEKELIPYLFKQSNFDSEKLIFTVIAGEEAHSPFQADKIDYSQQLQFVMISEDKKLLDDQFEEILNQLGLEQLRTNLKSITNIYAQHVVTDEFIKYRSWPLVQDAVGLSYSLTCYRNLQTMKAEKKKIDLQQKVDLVEATHKEIVEDLRNLYGIKIKKTAAEEKPSS